MGDTYTVVQKDNADFISKFIGAEFIGNGYASGKPDPSRFIFRTATCTFVLREGDLIKKDVYGHIDVC